MNSRIQELMNQAVFTDQIPYPSQEQVFQKFAELIVRECLEQVRDEVQYEYDWKLADAVSTRVLEHFGVES